MADQSGQTARQQFSLTVNPPTLSLTLGAALPNGTVGVGYNQRIQATATGGTPPYTWAIAAGSSLPAGLLFTPSAKSMFSFGLLVLVLLFRPQGISGRRAA